MENIEMQALVPANLEPQPHADHHDNLNINTIGKRRREALAAIDEAKISWFHVKVCVTAGVGFFTDAYDIFAINIASPIIGYVYYRDGLNSHQKFAIKVAALVGNVFGQVLFGWLADRVGRKRMYGIELMFVITATFAQALSASGGVVNIVVALAIWRFIMGVGIGGDYPLSAVIPSEFAPTKTRGRMMAVVFSAQGWGNFVSTLVGFILVAYNKHFHSNDFDDPHRVDYIWRILIGLGIIPGCLALYFRFTIPETPRFTLHIEQNVEQAQADINIILAAGEEEGLFGDDPIWHAPAPKSSWADFRQYFGRWENAKVLFGTVYSWFAIDIAFYGFTLNTSIFLTAINFGQEHLGLYTDLSHLCAGNMIISAAGVLPGYFASIVFIDSWGRKRIQMMGFIMLTVMLGTLGFAYDRLQESPAGQKAFFFLFCLLTFFFNFGPNVTTFIIPGEVFPTRYRSTAHGISAASGKIGAIISQIVLTLTMDGDSGLPSKSFKHVLEIFALITLTGAFSTLLLPEPNRRNLEELSDEYLEDSITDGAGHDFIIR